MIYSLTFTSLMLDFRMFYKENPCVEDLNFWRFSHT